MDAKFHNKIDPRYVWAALLGYIFLSLFSVFDFFTMILSLCLSGYSLKISTDQRKESGWSYVIQSFYTIIFNLFFLISGYPAGYFLMYLGSLVCLHSILFKKQYISILLAIYASFVIMMLFFDGEMYWTVSYCLLFGLFGLFTLLFLTSILGFKISAVSYLGLMAILRIANLFYMAYRYSTIGITDLLMLPSFLDLVTTYKIKPNSGLDIYYIICVLVILPFFFMTSFKTKDLFASCKQYKWIRLIIPACSCILLYTIGYRAQDINKSVDEKTGTFFDLFALSIVEQIDILTYHAPDSLEMNQLANMESDLPGDEIHPHIITIMSESYSDVSEILKLDINENPLSGFYALENEHTEIGEAEVNVFGGGTSVSEWEYLTGLDRDSFSVLAVPFQSSIFTDHSFTADPFYDDYEKLFIHPYKRAGYNRMNAYDKFQYDRTVFIEDMEFEEGDFVRMYPGDKYLFDLITEEIENADTPLFNMSVTMQNHGSYQPDRGILENMDIKVKNTSYTDEESFALTTYLQLSKTTTEEFAEFIRYLDEHPEYPVLLIYFGDHYPADVPVPDDMSDVYKVPYLVYCNYKDLNEMPETLKLSLLYPNAKKAAGLPLTAWEKYLLSLNGNTAPKDITLSRIRYGADPK